jgi:hypothetical protein
VNLLINTVISSLNGFHFNCDENRDTDPNSKRNQTYNQSDYLTLLHVISLSKLITLDVSLHDVSFGVLVAVAVSAILKIHRIRVNLVDLLGLVCIIVCVEVVLEVVGLQSYCVYLTKVLVDVFPSKLIRILHIIVVGDSEVRVI